MSDLGGPAPRLAVDAGRSSLEAVRLPTMQRPTLLDHVLSDTADLQFLLGDGGVGKSVLLGQLADKLHWGAEHNDQGALVLVQCSGISPKADLTFSEQADLEFGRAVGGMGRELGLSGLVNVMHEEYSDVFVLIDTLDLVLNEHTVISIATLLTELSTRARLILTCRQREYDDLLADVKASAPQLASRRIRSRKMPLLSGEEIVRWARAYLQGVELPDGERDLFLEDLSDAVRSSTLREVCEVPLRLGIACELFAGRGHLPEDLSVANLYETYWDERVRRHQGRKSTTAAKEQERAAIWLAGRILTQSVDRLILSIPDSPDNPAGLTHLVSEGIVRERNGIVEFFHQTYAEYAVGRLLGTAGTAEQLSGLREGLEASRAYLWPVARFMLLRPSAEQRFHLVQAAVPMETPDGARTHLLAALNRSDAAHLTAMARTAKAVDPQLVYPLMPLLANAPDSCRAEAFELALETLSECQSALVGSVARTLGTLICRSRSDARPSLLRRALVVADERRTTMHAEVWVHLPEDIIGGVCTSNTPDQGSLVELRRWYGQTIPRAQRHILRAHLAVPLSDQDALAFANTVLAVDLPSDLEPTELVALAQLFWLTPAVKESRAWSSWRVFLQADLPKNWFAAQELFVARLASDVATREEVFAAALAGAADVARSRLIAVAKRVAAEHPKWMADRLLRTPTPTDSAGVGGYAMVAKALVATPALEHGSVKRRRIFERLLACSPIDPKKIWAVLIELAADDIDLYDKLLLQFESDDLHARARNSATATLVQVLSKPNLHALAPRLRALLEKREREDSLPRARLEGRLALIDGHAREWSARSLLDGPSPAVASRVAYSIRDSLKEDGASLTADNICWMAGMISTRHTDAAKTLISILANNVPSDQLSAAPQLTTTCAQLLERTVRNPTESQLTREILGLLRRLRDADALDQETVRAVIATVAEPVRQIPQYRETANERANADLKRFTACLRALALDTLPIPEVRTIVTEALAGWDSDEIGTRSRRALAGLFTAMCWTDQDNARWLVEQWQQSRTGNRRAIAEALVDYERTSPGTYALDLARRKDCPPEIAAYILSARRE